MFQGLRAFCVITCGAAKSGKLASLFICSILGYSLNESLYKAFRAATQINWDCFDHCNLLRIGFETSVTTFCAIYTNQGEGDNAILIMILSLFYMNGLLSFSFLTHDPWNELKKNTTLRAVPHSSFVAIKFEMQGLEMLICSSITTTPHKLSIWYIFITKGPTFAVYCLAHKTENIEASSKFLLKSDAFKHELIILVRENFKSFPFLNKHQFNST